MISKWNPGHREKVTNDILATYGIPAMIGQVASPQKLMWAVRVFGGTIESVLDRIHKKQDSILQRTMKQGITSISRHDALFMYVTQWLEFTVNGGAADPDREQVEALMEYWLHVYNLLNNQLVN